ncbi:translation elongation factor EF-1 alpha (eEF1A) lysine 390 methyltransferase Efm6 [Schizosaccharomyces osmophilus]|uniref:Translation elongation factor EF-1 alpha (EEF1A) lysine 390 methyltransferase Efm6 n=1 Tax=Schizosaccharomyces osmophilus TaxID=2545709 RepID=A0AAF0ASM8_9SCHI|nr:translation elongation factor EF-1 alpha (eEF1A) lysine 390 methyltransferase Efm6 [Schizosaccharomyces osmophilus]WBW71041.1 translation elongation factor EF-1 alpha (eEF1A) lysine 390 methyltransferase Efm6 [Schizosaccharomyces osmophilus]
MAHFYHIRFLKVQPVNARGSKTGIIKAVFTLTTDLGEFFYPERCPLQVVVADVSNGKPIPLKSESVVWNGYEVASTLSISIPVSSKQLQLILFPQTTTPNISPHEYHVILPVWSDSFSLTKNEGPKHVWRYLEHNDWEPFGLCFLEQMGESIAKHIWDAGIILSEKILRQEPEWTLSDKKDLQVLELGSGCGILGISVASKYPNASVCMTDLDDALGILQANITKNQHLLHNNISTDLFVWSSQIPPKLQKRWDYVLMSDVMYNESSFSSLETALKFLMQSQTRIFISYKKRHENEKTFMDHLLQWCILEHETVLDSIILYSLVKK